MEIVRVSRESVTVRLNMGRAIGVKHGWAFGYFHSFDCFTGSFQIDFANLVMLFITLPWMIINEDSINYPREVIPSSKIKHRVTGFEFSEVCLQLQVQAIFAEPIKSSWNSRDLMLILLDVTPISDVLYLSDISDKSNFIEKLSNYY